MLNAFSDGCCIKNVKAKVWWFCAQAVQSGRCVYKPSSTVVDYEPLCKFLNHSGLRFLKEEKCKGPCSRTTVLCRYSWTVPCKLRSLHACSPAGGADLEGCGTFRKEELRWRKWSLGVGLEIF